MTEQTRRRPADAIKLQSCGFIDERQVRLESRDAAETQCDVVFNVPG